MPRRSSSRGVRRRTRLGKLRLLEEPEPGPLPHHQKENHMTPENPPIENTAVPAPITFSDKVEPRCDHSECDQATCPWDVCASPYWEERRLHAILMYPNASRGEIHARM